MAQQRNVSEYPSHYGDVREYVAPQLTLIGDAAEVVLGVAGSGDDYFGYTPPEFEFQPDGDAL